jgi:hypothetical protein
LIKNIYTQISELKSPTARFLFHPVFPSLTFSVLFVAACCATHDDPSPRVLLLPAYVSEDSVVVDL